MASGRGSIQEKKEMRHKDSLKKSGARRKEGYYQSVVRDSSLGNKCEER